jgi:hypothetical protein
VGDVNGDGRPDLVVGSPFSGTVSVLLNLGGGRFGAGSEMAAGQAPIALALADLDGDGRIDLVVADAGANSLIAFQGNGDGTFQPGRAQSLGANSGPSAIAIADLNGDGHPDAIVANELAATVSVLLGQGDGTFSPRVDHATASGSVALVTGDLDGNGRVDVVVASPFAGVVSVLLGKGDGGFLPRVDRASAAPRAVAMGDFNADGTPDVAVAGGDPAQVTVWPGPIYPSPVSAQLQAR